MDTNINDRVLELKKIYLENKPTGTLKVNDINKYKIIKILSPDLNGVNFDKNNILSNKRSFSDLDHLDKNPNKLRIVSQFRPNHKSCKLCKHIICLNKFCKYTHLPITSDEQFSNITRTNDSLCLCGKIPGTCDKSKNNEILDNQEMLIGKFESLKVMDRSKAEFCTPCKYNKKCFLIKENKCAFHHTGQICSCYEQSLEVGKCLKAKIKKLQNSLIN